jgi:hypothetical protein
MLAHGRGTQCERSERATEQGGPVTLPVAGFCRDDVADTAAERCGGWGSRLVLALAGDSGAVESFASSDDREV